MTMFLFNAWYCAAWSTELEAGQILSRRYLDLPVVLFRNADGSACALLDRCPHRFAPLSRGTLAEGVLTCGYHGLAFDGAGQCVANPFNESLPPNSGVRRFPIVERDRVIWIWPGDPALADETAIPDYSEIRNVGEKQGYLYLRANYLLAVDNLMDLSHIEFVHLRSFGGAGAFFSGKHETRRTGPSEIWSLWDMRNVDAPAPARAAFGDMKVDHWQNMRWNAPANLYFEVGVCPAGVEPDPALQPGPQAHLLTPETQHTTHYFYSKDVGRAGSCSDGLRRIPFGEEDGSMMEACQANMGDDFWAERPWVLKTDSAAVLVRRTLEKLVREEMAS